MKHWRIRRRLIYSSMLLGALMIVIGARAIWEDKLGAGDLITGGVALISLVLGGYIGGAAYEDVRVRQMGASEDG